MRQKSRVGNATDAAANEVGIFGSVSEDRLVSCVSCGLCLPHCPTFRVTGDDAMSPRGRISLIAAVRSGTLDFDADVEAALEACVQCMGCLPACPSGVRYDEIIEPALLEVTRRNRTRRITMRFLLAPIGKPRLLRSLSIMGAVAQRLRLMPAKLSLPPLSIRRVRPRAVPRVHSDSEPTVVTVFSGCVMDAWYPQVHQATIDVLEALGHVVDLTDPSLCCGALHRHAGLVGRAERFETACQRNLGDRTVVVNSAGCGANLMGRVPGAIDIMEFLADRIRDLKTVTTATDEKILVHDPCHSRNLQKSHLRTHEVLGCLYDVETLSDEGLCCGAGGAFSLTHAELAEQIVERKFDAIRIASSSRILASGNPGCSAHMQAHLPDDLGGLHISHPIELVARCLNVAARIDREDPTDGR